MNDRPESARSTTNNGRNRRVQSVDHAIDLLDALVDAPAAGRGVSELARLAGLNKATTHHLLLTLESRRMVMKDPRSATYRLGWALHEYGTLVSRRSDVARIARPYLDEVAQETKESVLLGIRVERFVQYLDRGDSHGGFTMMATTGMRSPLHSNASGKLLLAFCDAGFVDDFLAGPLESFTPHTLTDPTAIRAQLDVIRRDRYATCWEERELGLSSVSVPIVDHTGRVHASLTVAGPAGRVTDDSLERLMIPLRSAATAISAQLGAAGDS
jgi:DNA-binding IclR family transcriptional regulator